MNTQALLIFFIAALGTACGPNALATTSFLNKFRSDPKIAMDLMPEKTGDRVAQEIIDDKITACRRDASRDAIREASRWAIRETSHNIGHHGLGVVFAPKTDQENPEHFLEAEKILTDISSLDTHRKGEVDIQPWSGDYWPIRNGGAARRYRDKNAPPPGAASTWTEGFEYFTKNPSAEAEIDLLSPAEKYDRLLGDDSYTLAHSSWEEGKSNFDEHGQVESWMGICHGWAPASFMEPRPTHKIKLNTFKSNEEIIFRPDDLKALASLKWANGINIKNDRSELGTRFIGQRCAQKSPKRDPETGRILDQECFDLNPGAWHQVVINQVAVAKRPFVIDAAFDYEVWNQPVVAYSFRYFNPISFDTTDVLSEARVKLDDPKLHDKFKKFRNNPLAVEIVGVIMAVTYVIESKPRGLNTDEPERDLRTTVHYHYDLELDAKGEILGGEWYQNAHPDFIWMPVKNSTALNIEDLKVNSIDTAVATASTASKTNAPLRFVLDKLLELATGALPSGHR